MNKALQYAEQELGVHTVYREAEQLVEEIDRISAELDVWHDDKRSIVEDIADREALLLGEERARHPEMSATGLDQHLRSQKRLDPELKTLRDKLNQRLADISGGEYDLAVLNSRLRIKVARMEELGGYLNYLAAVKQDSIGLAVSRSHEANKATQPTEPTEPT